MNRMNPVNVSRYIRAHERQSRMVGGYEVQPAASGRRYNASGSLVSAMQAAPAPMAPRFGHAAGYPQTVGTAPQTTSPQPVLGSVVQASSLPIIINVTNSAGTAATCTLFGAAANQAVTNFGNPVAIQIASGNPNVSYQQIISNTISTSFSCSYIRLIDTQVTNQVQQAWTITSVNMEGQLVSTPIPNSASFSPFQQQAGILDLIYPLKIDALTSVQFTMLGSNTLTLYFYPATVVSPVHTLVNGNAERQYATPNLPTVFSTAPVVGIQS
jgi:hypothetical protein